MRKMLAVVLCVAGAVALFSGPGRAGEEGLTVTGGEPFSYECEGGAGIVARYYALSDGSLHFVKLFMQDGGGYTLPQVLSASGARYSDDRELTWWVKGDAAVAEHRDPQGRWVPRWTCSLIPRRE